MCSSRLLLPFFSVYTDRAAPAGRPSRSLPKDSESLHRPRPCPQERPYGLTMEKATALPGLAQPVLSDHIQTVFPPTDAQRRPRTPPHALLCARPGRGLWQLPGLQSSSLTSDGKAPTSSSLELAEAKLWSD